MKYSEFTKYLERLEATSKRLEITTILSDLLKKLEDTEIDLGIYLSLGYLKAPYESEKFNIAEKMMIKILEGAYACTKERINKQFSKTGDLGDIAYELAEKQKTKDLDIKDVHKLLVDIARIEGGGSQDIKARKTAELLRQLDPISAKYTVRIMLGTTRLGFTELTIIAALAEMLNDKTTADKIEATYNIHPDIGLIAKNIKKHGMKGVEDIKIQIGVPILSQRCQRLTDPQEIIEKMGKVWGEFKFDGTRVQLHMDRNAKPVKNTSAVAQTELFQGTLTDPKDTALVRTFTRNQEETTHQYPDLVEAAIKQLNATSVILDGEAIGYNKETGDFLPFQEIMQRKRKHGIAEMAKDIPLKYFVFDLLYLDGKDLTSLPLIERRNLLESIVKTNSTGTTSLNTNVIIVDSHIETESADELLEFFEEAKEKNLEGVIVKKPDDPYQAGARSFSWIKWKKADTKMLNDTVDCVVLGYYFGKGVRAQYGIGGFLAGVYDPKTDTYKTITKVGTGLKEDDWIFLKKEADKIKTPEKPTNVEIDKIFTPDVWVTPKIVVELATDEISRSPTHTAGYALRFPRLITFRSDRKSIDTTSVEEIITLHNQQKRGYY